MTQQQALQLFEEKRVRTVWDDEQEKWYFSIVDVVAVLTGSDRPRKYWSDLKKKLQQEGSEVSEKIGQFKMKAEDGKNRITDVASNNAAATEEQAATVNQILNLSSSIVDDSARISDETSKLSDVSERITGYSAAISDDLQNFTL